MPPKIKFTVQNKEKLIELVRKQEALYNSSCKQHHDANYLFNCWSSIAQIVNIPGAEGKQCFFSNLFLR